MSYMLVKWAINSSAIFLITRMIKGISVDSLAPVVIVAWALLIGLFNTFFLKPVLMLLSLPINLLTLGLFTLLTNGVIMYISTQIIDGLFLSSLGSALWGALLFSIITALLNLFIES